MPTFIRFGDFRIAPAARELWQSGQLVTLPPKSFDCLVYLIEHRDRAVGRDELISAVWGRADVSDDLLAQTLLRARRAVGDTGNEQRVIRTVPRFGYRWVLALDDAEAAAHEAPDAARVRAEGVDPSHPVVPVSSKRSRSAIRFAAALIALALGVGCLFLLRQRLERPSSAIAASAIIVVLPVQRSGGDNEMAWLRLGAMDYIASRLRERAHLSVLPSEQTLLLLGRSGDATDAGALHRLELATNASYILAVHAAWNGGAWTFELDAHHGDAVRSYAAVDGDPLEAARIAVDRFIGNLGVAVARTSSKPPQATEQVKRIDAAMLAGDIAEAERLVDALPEDARSAPDVAVRIGQIAFRAGRLDAAKDVMGPMLARADLTPAVRAQTLMGLGAIAVREGDFDAADRSYSAAIALLTDSNVVEPGLLGSAYSGRGAANAARHRVDAALADLGSARIELERAGDRTGAAAVDVNLGLLEAGRGHGRDAAQAFDRAIAIFTRFDVRDDLAAALVGKTNAELAMLDRDAAMDDSARAWTIAGTLDNPLLKRRIAAVRARALLAHGDLGAAQAVLDAGDRFATALAADAELGFLRARLILERGDVGAAERKLLETLDQTQVPRADFNVDALRLAIVAARRGGAALERVLARARSDAQGANVDLALALELGDAQRLARSDAVAAPEALAKAFNDADQRGDADSVVAAGVAYAAFLIGERNLAPATALAGRLQLYGGRDYEAARALAALYRAMGDDVPARNAAAQVQSLAGERDPRLPL